MPAVALSVQPSLQFQATSTIRLPDGDIDMVDGPEIEGTVPSLQPATQSEAAFAGRLLGGDVDLATCKATPRVCLV